MARALAPHGDLEPAQPLPIPCNLEELVVSRGETTRQRQLREVQREAMRSAHWSNQVPRYIGASEVEFATMMDDRHSR